MLIVSLVLHAITLPVTMYLLWRAKYPPKIRIKVNVPKMVADFKARSNAPVMPPPPEGYPEVVRFESMINNLDTQKPQL